MKKKQLLSLLIIILFFIICPYMVSAIEIGIRADNTKIKSGDRVSISINVKDISIDEGMNSIQGQLIYDKNDWEIVTAEDVKSKNNWAITYNDEQTESEGKFILINFGLGETEEQELAEITLKSKRKIINGKSEIKLIELYTTDGENMIKLDDQVKQISIQGNMIVLLIIIVLSVIIVVEIIVLVIKIRRKKK